MTGPLSGSQSHLVGQEEQGGMCSAGGFMWLGGEQKGVHSYLNVLEKTFDCDRGYDEMRLVFFPCFWNS